MTTQDSLISLSHYRFINTGESTLNIISGSSTASQANANTGTIVGGAVGGVAAIIIVGYGIWAMISGQGHRGNHLDQVTIA